MKSLLIFTISLFIILLTTDRVSSQTSAQLRFLQMERSLNKFWIPIAKRKVPTRDEWYMEYGPISTLLDSLEFYPTNLFFSPKDSLSVKLNSSTGTDVNFVEGSGIYLNRIDSFNMEIANVQSHYCQLRADLDVGFTEIAQIVNVNTLTDLDFTAYEKNGFSLTEDLANDQIEVLEDGTYRIAFSTIVRITPANEQISIRLYINGDQVTQAYRYLDHPTLESLTASFTIIKELVAGDIVKIKMRYANPTIPPPNALIYFSMMQPALSLQRIK